MELPAGRLSGNIIQMSTGLATASSELTLTRTRLNVTERWEKALEMVDNVVHPVCLSMPELNVSDSKPSGAVPTYS